MNSKEYQRRVENVKWIQEHRKRFCPRCGSYGRVYGEHYCEHCQDDYDRENIEAFDKACNGKPFFIFNDTCT